MLSFMFNGVELSASDFPRDVQGYIAFSIASACNTHCRDKEAAIELLMYEAEKLIEVAQSGVAPV